MPDVLQVAASYENTPYALPPDGVTTLDCSLFILKVADQLGIPLPQGVRTAEQIRQACPTIVPFDQVRPGDLLFFRDTYASGHTPGPDGLTATHVGISLGAGTRQMWDANDARGDVGITNISGQYWQPRLIEARRLPGLAGPAKPMASGPYLRLTAAGVRLRAEPNTVADILVEDLGLGTVVQAVSEYAWREIVTRDGMAGWTAARYLARVEPTADEGLSMEPDHQFSFDELWPTIQAAAVHYGADGQVMAGIIQQESRWRNYRVHLDGTGHGLAGLDDNGLLRPFEEWSGLTIGRGRSAAIIPPGMQIAFLAKTIAEYTTRLGDPFRAARAWHRGEGQWSDTLGGRYEALIRGHIAELFG